MQCHAFAPPTACRCPGRGCLHAAARNKHRQRHSFAPTTARCRPGRVCLHAAARDEQRQRYSFASTTAPRSPDGLCRPAAFAGSTSSAAPADQWLHRAWRRGDGACPTPPPARALSVPHVRTNDRRTLDCYRLMPRLPSPGGPAGSSGFAAGLHQQLYCADPTASAFTPPTQQAPAAPRVPIDDLTTHIWPRPLHAAARCEPGQRCAFQPATAARTPDGLHLTPPRARSTGGAVGSHRRPQDFSGGLDWIHFAAV